jgi:hypothetical protein
MGVAAVVDHLDDERAEEAPDEQRRQRDADGDVASDPG